ncbi:CLUMA_CG006464, isoform A [Clunio marinus]|uniref:CLUMA_CG006464, isoform A n=1 Tax=Clunio marinus TaxID=568069 RepID=A0A1J1HYI2_9DIPT|nr:CLUMA_CG006464, isoform A [Clunio marinus]
MNSLNLVDFNIEDQLNQCRCCLRTLIDENKFVKISKLIEQRFFDLTQIELIESKDFSSKICLLCNNDLEVFSHFRKDLTDKQKFLYKTLNEKEPHQTEVDIFNENSFELKPNVDDFVACNTSNLLEEEINFDNQIQIKLEAEEIEKNISSDHCQIQNSYSKTKKRAKNLKCSSSNAKLQNTKSSSSDKSEKSKKEKCKLCNVKVRNLNSHIKAVHSLLNDFKCDICSYVSCFKIEMENHMLNHIKHEPQLFYCEFCSKDFGKRHLLNRHIKLKHMQKERLHPCPTCNKSFFTISTLKKHIESHRDKDMPCEFCGKLFSCMNNLRTHLYYHSEPKFVCTFEACGKKFFMRKLLRAHVNVHQGKKDFTCSFCEKSYFFQSHLKRHIISAHMKLKIDCEVLSCSSSFARKETYRNHVLQHHQNLGSQSLNALLTKIRNLKVEEYRCVA